MLGLRMMVCFMKDMLRIIGLDRLDCIINFCGVAGMWGCTVVLPHQALGLRLFRVHSGVIPELLLTYISSRSRFRVYSRVIRAADVWISRQRSVVRRVARGNFYGESGS